LKNDGSNFFESEIDMKTAQDLVTEAKSTVREVPLDQAETAIRNANVVLDVREAEGAEIQVTMMLIKNHGMRVKVYPGQRQTPTPWQLTSPSLQCLAPLRPCSGDAFF
jgi:hypothetical protein